MLNVYPLVTRETISFRPRRNSIGCLSHVVEWLLI
jgi:hypothetical protein